MQPLTAVQGLGFNPRSRGGSDIGAVDTAEDIDLFQSTLPRGERPPDLPGRNYRPGVSIHAPEGGATEEATEDAIESIVSIHAPEGGATGHRL